MGQAVLRIERLPDSSLEAAAAFYAEWIERARELLAEGCSSLVILVPSAPYDHTGWRRAAVRDLARAAAAARVNLIAGDDEDAIEASLAYLATAPGVTGQYLPLART